MAPPLSDENTVKVQLAKLRDVPDATPSEAILFLMFDYLIGPLPSKSTHSIPSHSVSDRSRKHKHWFCSRADEVVVEAATFLLRLHAYTSSRVDLWREELSGCLRECCDCVRELLLIKLSSRHT